MKIRSGRKGLASLAQRAQTTSAYAHLAPLAVDLDACPLDVGLELTLGCPVRVADVVSKLRTLTTHIALCHCLSPLCVLSGAYDTTRGVFVQQRCTGRLAGHWPTLAKLSPMEDLE